MVNRKIKNTIYIYADKGAGKIALQHTYKFFVKMFGPKYKLVHLLCEELKKGNWIDDAAMLIMPGGADRFYHRRLKGAGNQIIRNYVESGGVYIGLCAGAYFAAANIEFDKNGPLETIGERELKFFPGKAIGPLLASYDYNGNKGARIAKIKTPKGIINMFFNGGCYFDNADKYSDLEILGWYIMRNEVRIPAILCISLGRGKVLLSGVHFEFLEEFLEVDEPHMPQLIADLRRDREIRLSFAEEILKKVI